MRKAAEMERIVVGERRLQKPSLRQARPFVKASPSIRQHVLSLGVALLLSACWPIAAQQVHFDVLPVISAPEVTTEEFAEWNPDEKLIEVNIQVSTLMSHVSDGDIHYFLFRIESPRGRMHVVDFSPRTLLQSDVVGNVGVQTSQQRDQSAGITAGGDLPAVVTLDATAGLTNKQSAQFKYEILPRQEVLMASGTTRRGTGAYFKLRPSSQESLEGSRDFQLVLRVPQAWRADKLVVYCYAYGANPKGANRAAVRWGQATFAVAVHAAGDIEAKHLAREYVTAEADVRQLLVRHGSARDHLQHRPANLEQVWKRLVGAERHEHSAGKTYARMTLEPDLALRSDQFKQLPRNVQDAVHHLADVQQSMLDLRPQL